MNVQSETVTAFGMERWRWLNQPTNWVTGDAGLEVTTDTDTDFWRTTHYGFVRDTGHALLRGVGNEFRMAATFHGDYREQYDQAGLLLRVDGHNWVKTGIEFVDGKQLLSAVVTREVSDWNVVPLNRLAGHPHWITIELHRRGDTVTISYGWDDEEPGTLLRVAYFPPDISAEAGPMCASPDGKGFRTHFSALSLTED